MKTLVTILILVALIASCDIMGDDADARDKYPVCGTPTLDNPEIPIITPAQ